MAMAETGDRSSDNTPGAEQPGQETAVSDQVEIPTICERPNWVAGSKCQRNRVEVTSAADALPSFPWQTLDAGSSWPERWL